jgi:predicted Kef-type K+ transport protein
MDVLLIAVAFFFGLLAQQFGLPPLVGFLISGFALHALVQGGGQNYHRPKASFCAVC